MVAVGAAVRLVDGGTRYTLAPRRARRRIPARAVPVVTPAHPMPDGLLVVFHVEVPVRAAVVVLKKIPPPK